MIEDYSSPPYLIFFLYKIALGKNTSTTNEKRKPDLKVKKPQARNFPSWSKQVEAEQKELARK